MVELPSGKFLKIIDHCFICGHRGTVPLHPCKHSVTCRDCARLFSWCPHCMCKKSFFFDPWCIYGREKLLKGPFVSGITADNGDDSLCAVCAIENVSTAFGDCGHLCVCDDCSRRLKTCPICRQGIGYIFIVKPCVAPGARPKLQSAKKSPASNK